MNKDVQDYILFWNLRRLGRIFVGCARCLGYLINENDGDRKTRVGLTGRRMYVCVE